APADPTVTSCGPDPGVLLHAVAMQQTTSHRARTARAGSGILLRATEVPVARHGLPGNAVPVGGEPVDTAARGSPAVRAGTSSDQPPAVARRWATMASKAITAPPALPGAPRRIPHHGRPASPPRKRDPGAVLRAA